MMHTGWGMILLAVLQGVTEFLPVSSSGHLVLARHIMQLDAGDGPLIELVLHAGTLVAIVVFFRRRIAVLLRDLLGGDPAQRRYAGMLVLGMLPAILFYTIAGGWIGRLFAIPRVASGALVVTGVILISTLRLRNPPGSRPITPCRALAIGLVQAVALIPGISRSGATIAVAQHLGVDADTAAEYSFLTALPLFAGGTLLAALELARGAELGDVTVFDLTLGFFVAAATGLGAMWLLMWVLRRRLFPGFGLYCLIVGVTTWILN